MACGTPERGFPPLVWHASLCGGRVFLQILVVLGATNHTEVVASGGRGTFGLVVVPHPSKEGGRTTGPGLRGSGLLCVVANELQAEFIYEHVEGAKLVAGMRVGSVGIHDYVFMQNYVKKSRELTYLV